MFSDNASGTSSSVGGDVTEPGWCYYSRFTTVVHSDSIIYPGQYTAAAAGVSAAATTAGNIE